MRALLAGLLTMSAAAADGPARWVIDEQYRAYCRAFLALDGPLVPDRFTRHPALASNDALLGLAVALIAGPELGLIDAAEAERRGAVLIDWLEHRIARDASGVIVHFSQTDSGAAATGSEFSILSAAYSVLGARLLGARYPALAAGAERYAESIRWADYLAPSGRFHFSRAADGTLRDVAGYFTEEFVVVLAVARASRAHPVPETVWRTALWYRPATLATGLFGTLEIPAVTDDAASFEVLLAGGFWDPRAVPTPIDLERNAVMTLLAQRAHCREGLGLPVGLGRSPQYHRDDTYHLLGAAPFGGSDRARVEPGLCGPTQALAALPFELREPRLRVDEDLLVYAAVPGIRLPPHGAFAESLRFGAGEPEAGLHLTSWNATLALIGLHNRCTDNGLWRLNPVPLDRRP